MLVTYEDTIYSVPYVKKGVWVLRYSYEKERFSAPIDNDIYMITGKLNKSDKVIIKYDVSLLFRENYQDVLYGKIIDIKKAE